MSWKKNLSCRGKWKGQKLDVSTFDGRRMQEAARAVGASKAQYERSESRPTRRMEFQCWIVETQNHGQGDEERCHVSLPSLLMVCMPTAISQERRKRSNLPSDQIGRAEVVSLPCLPIASRPPTRRVSDGGID